MRNVFKNCFGKTKRLSTIFNIKVLNRRYNKDGYSLVTVQVTVNSTLKLFEFPEYSNLSGKIFTGKAKCHPNDIFNEQTGYDIAEHRAMYKAYKYMWNILSKKQDDFIAMAESVEDYKIRIGNKMLKQLNCANSKGL